MDENEASVESDVLFQKFPSGGGLYRIHYAGSYIHPKSEHHTPRVGIWLSEVNLNSHGEFITKSISKNGSVFPELTFLVESAGSIPSLAIGTYWQDGHRVKIGGVPEDISESFEIGAHELWDMVVATDTISSQREMWIPTHSYQFCGIDVSDAFHNFAKAPMVRVTAKCGTQLLIPPYEIFRAYFCPCSELARELLSHRFDDAVAALAKHYKLPNLDSNIFEIELNKNIPEIAARYLALFLGTDVGTMRATSVRIDVVNQWRSDPMGTHWIKALPPFPDHDIQIKLAGKWITKRGENSHRKSSREDRFFAFRITDSTFPSLPYQINHVSETKYIPTYTNEQPNAETGSTQEKEAKHRSVTQLIGDEDAEIGAAILHLPSLSVNWLRDSLPEINRVYRKIQEYPGGVRAQQSSPERNRASTGSKGAKGTFPQASLSSQDSEQVIERFMALELCLNTLKKNNIISDWQEHAIVRPINKLGRNYCALVDKDATIYYKWSLVYDPFIRSRLVWLIQLERKGHLIYLLDIEPRSKSDTYAILVFVPASKTLELKVIERLFNHCITKEGRFSNYSSSGFQGDLLWTKAFHKFEENQLDPEKLLGAIDEVIELSTS
ncbi:hypothetical protein H8K32_10025 [Undibacterium jejuense]|uniref:TnsE C-terminal domain-containing protein n=1 Tax=Undibacterium jejuense TaxID=1344949 RepID=A0A923HG69_9BURK|nr:hypothetical protein [Undibacterium jejuense]MBC3862435.1 hypothetical protein [Undibacterium jejuense]